jgi:hypothetical protein
LLNEGLFKEEAISMIVAGNLCKPGLAGCRALRYSVLWCLCLLAWSGLAVGGDDTPPRSEAHSDVLLIGMAESFTHDLPSALAHSTVTPFEMVMARTTGLRDRLKLGIPMNQLADC